VKHWGRLVVAVALTTNAFWTSNAAADGEPVVGFGANGVMIDSSFSGGKLIRPEQVVQLPGGSFVVSGFLQTAGQAAVQQFVARYSAVGQLDPRFGNGGVIFPTGVVRDLTPLLDGRLLVTTLSPTGNLGFLEVDGSLTAVPVRTSPDQLVRRPDGATYALDTKNGTRVATLVRPDGSIDRTFTSDVASLLPPGSRMGASNVAYSPPNATLLSDGRLVVAFAYTAATSNVFCGLVALHSDGRLDATFGVNGLVSMSQAVCRVDHFADDTIRVIGDFGDPVVSVSPDGLPLGAVSPPFDVPDLEFEGTGWSYTQGGPSEIVSLDPLGNPEPTFGVNGVATLTGMTISGFELLDSGDIVAWGNPVGSMTALALGLIDGSYGTALQPPAVVTTKFVPLPPRRILDTREGLGAPMAVVGVGGHLELQIPGAGGIPHGGVSAVVLNVTATEAVQAGYVSVYPSGTRRPTASNLNLEAGQTAANLVTVKVGANGKVTLFSSGGAHLVADVAGFYTEVTTSTDGRLQTATPERILDTREGIGAPRATPQAGGHIDLQVTGRGPVPATGVSAVVLNITGDQAVLDGFVTVWPTGIDRPLASNLNLVANDTRANLVVVPLGVDGKVSLFTSGGTELIADVTGWFTDASAPVDGAGLFVPITPTRVLDTRQEPSPPTAPVSSLTRLIGATTVVPPAAAIAIAATITMTESGGQGFVTAWPAHTARPLVSNLNATRAGQTVPNAAIVPLGLDELALYTQSGAHLVVDISGWYTSH
jgi:hypothetical protein